MGKEYHLKVFKSGNSLAMRIPKEMGLREGAVMRVREEQSGFRIELEEAPKRGIDVSGFWGKCPGIKLAPREDFDERPSVIAARLAAEGKSPA